MTEPFEELLLFDLAQHTSRRITTHGGPGCGGRVCLPRAVSSSPATPTASCGSGP